MTKRQPPWMSGTSRSKSSQGGVPEMGKAEVTTQANKLIETGLNPGKINHHLTIRNSITSSIFTGSGITAISTSARPIVFRDQMQQCQALKRNLRVWST